MSKLTARPEELEATEYDFGDVVAKIENIEQSIIQHIRIAGIRKPRETSLVDEMMDLRRERRKFSASVHAQLRSLDNQNKALSEEILTLKDKVAQESQSLNDLERRSMDTRESERVHFEERLKKELDTQEEKMKFMEKINIAKVRNKYEERMKQIEMKMNEVFHEKAKAELKDARSIALKLVEKAKIEIEKRCNEKIDE